MKRSAWRYLWTSEDIRKKLIITILLLVVYRLAATIPVPGVNRDVIASIATAGGAGSGLFGLLDLLSGGTISNFSILAMGVYPYITAQIIIQLLVPIIPALDRRLKDNPREGRVLMEKWTTMLTIPMALLSAIGQVNIFQTMVTTSVLTTPFGFTGASLLPTVTILVSMVAGTMFGIWLGQLISEFGIPNQGLSLIIFAGIIAKMPSNLVNILADKVNGWWMLILILAILGLTIFAIVFVQQGRRNVPVLFPGRRVGNRMSMPVRSNLPLMVNMAGMIPLIFAQTFLSFPALIASWFPKALATTGCTNSGCCSWRTDPKVPFKGSTPHHLPGCILPRFRGCAALHPGCNFAFVSKHFVRDLCCRFADRCGCCSRYLHHHRN